MFYSSFEPGEELDLLLKKKIIDRPVPAAVKRKPCPELGSKFSTEVPANLELINCLLDHGFGFQETTRSAKRFTSRFKHKGEVFAGEGKTQLMANCIAALRAADYLDSLQKRQ